MKVIYLKNRFISLIVFVCVVFIIFLSRLINWQIFNSAYYKMKAAQSHSYIMKTDPIRGEILDRFGIGLATNSVGYKLVLDDFNLTKGREAECINKILDLIRYLKIDWNDNLPIILDKNGKFVFDESNTKRLENFKKEISVKDESNPNSYIDYFKEKIHCDSGLPKKTIRDICSIYYSTRVNPTISDKINNKSACIISEFNIPGIRAETFSTRYYNPDNIAPHIIGYTGLMSAEEVEKYSNYSLDSIVGKSGVEQICEEYLRGLGGTKAFHFSKEGTVVGVDDVVLAQPGNSVFLTIDYNLQQVVQNSLKENVKAARVSSGAAVVLDVKNGEVLAAATCPDFELSRYVNDRSYYNELVNDKSLPLLNRAFSGIYPPGSTFKPLIAASALQEALLGGLEETIRCSGSYNYYKGYRLRCTGVHGEANLLRGMARSCNVFFAELGKRLGLSGIEKYAKEFGISGKTGLELPESAGTVYDLEKKSKYVSGASQSAIGQGEIAISALQLAKIPLGVASGFNFRPRILKKVTNYMRNEDIKVFDPEFKKINISEENLNLTRQAMREVVLTGLARNFRNFPVSVAAKTGTAQNSGADHATFICYAPYEDPQIAIAVIVANAVQGKFPQNVARDAMKAYFKL